MDSYTIEQIGTVHVSGEMFIRVKEEYRQALEGLDEFGYINVIWWFSDCDNSSSRGKLVEKKPYTHGPQVLGTFATRAPERPNPLALSCAYITYIDHDRGVIGLAYIDADDGTPVLDIKPYVPSLDRVEEPQVPAWCAHWPKSIETSGDFDWEQEFNF